MLRILLARHGETEANASNLIEGHSHGKLTERGIEQTKALGERLKNEKITAIYCSDFERAAESALHAGMHHSHLKVIKSELMRERAFGEFEGKSISQTYKTHSQIFSGQKPTGGEAGSEVRKRAEEFLAMLLKKHDNETILIMGHAVFNNAFLSAIAGSEMYNPWFNQNNACLSEIVYNDAETGENRIVSLNDCSHLPERLAGSRVC